MNAWLQFKIWKSLKVWQNLCPKRLHQLRKSAENLDITKIFMHVPNATARDGLFISAPGRWRCAFACCTATVHNERLRREKWCRWWNTRYFLFALTYTNVLVKTRGLSLDQECRHDRASCCWVCSTWLHLGLKCVDCLSWHIFRGVLWKGFACQTATTAGITKWYKIPNPFPSVKRMVHLSNGERNLYWRSGYQRLTLLLISYGGW